MQRKLLDESGKKVVDINDGLSLALSIKDERERVENNINRREVCCSAVNDLLG